MTVSTTFPPNDQDTMCDVQNHDDVTNTVLPPTPPSSRSSRESSPSPTVEADIAEEQSGAAKKKKKKKAKKPAKAKESPSGGKHTEEAEERPPVLCISRNKHWRYISSYHVCWKARGGIVALIPFCVLGTVAAAAG